VLPKIETTQQLDDVYNIFQYYEVENFEWILLIESPLALNNISALLVNKTYPVQGVSLGSQDYAAKIGMCYSYERLSWASNAVLNAAYTFGIEAIDFADMIINDTKTFKRHALESFRMGYTAKLITHPNQLQALSEIEYYSDLEIKNALQIAEKVDLSKIDELSIVFVDGKLYEKPHITRIKKIINFAKPL
jgi:citrate lyase beta subunit